MIIDTIISYGFHDLLEIFFKANDLDVKCLLNEKNNSTSIEYDNNSETAYRITYMSIRHLGFENMLCDYIIRCGYPSNLIPHGRTIIKRDMKKLDDDWLKYRNQLGFR